jgi:hypothetical protein
MAGRDGKKQARSAKAGRRLLVGMGASAGVFLAAAAMATGSTVTAAPAKADFDALIDPIIQPILTSLTDSIGAFDPAAAVDLTSWTDSFLASLNSLDLALPSAAESAASAASSTTTISGPDDIPLTVQEGTEPTVDVSVDGSTAEPTLVDTGSSGLLVPINNLSLTQLFDLGFPTGINSTSFSGGVDVFYLEYNDATVDYGDGTLTTNTPIDVEFFSFPTSLSAGSPLDFQQFLSDNDSPGGILGIGDSGETGPGTSPFEAAGVSGVTVDVPQGELVVGSNAGTPIEPALNGAATPVNNLTETVTNSADQVIGTGAVSDDVDSGGVFGTIPSTIANNVVPGDTISVYDGTTLLYSYPVQTIDTAGDTSAPIVTTGASGVNAIDSGAEPFLKEPIFISYGGTDGAITFDEPGSGTA